jgi:hypothetical protein
MSADGSQQRQLTRGLEANALSLQSWAPDSTRLAFDSSGEKGIWIVDVGDFRVQSRRPGESLVAPSWSPNGRWIAVNTFSDTLVMKPNGKLVRRWSGIDGGLRAPSWSPDSRAVAVASDAKDDTVRDIWVGALASGPARRITSGWRYGYSSWAPEWNPAGFATSRLGGRSVEHSIPTDSITESAMSLATTRPVQRLVADGSAVAIGYQRPAPNQGSTVSEIWRPQLRSVVRFRINGSIGFAGERIVWMLGPSPGGGVDFWNVYTATLSEPRIRRYDDTSAWQITRPLSDPVGDSALLTLSSWGPCRISMNPPCAREPKRNGELYLLGAERDDAPYLNGVKTTRIASNSGLLTAIGVDAERILVDHEDGTYELRRSDGSVIRTFRLNAVVVRVVKLQGRELVVRTTSAVEVTNAENGEFLGRWPLPSTDARLEDVQDGIAVFLDGRTITLLRLSDGRTKEIDVPGIGQTLAQLEPSGLFYAYRVDDPKHQGRVRFMPFAQIELAQG